MTEACWFRSDKDVIGPRPVPGYHLVMKYGGSKIRWLLESHANLTISSKSACSMYSSNVIFPLKGTGVSRQGSHPENIQCCGYSHVTSSRRSCMAIIFPPIRVSSLDAEI